MSVGLSDLVTLPCDPDMLSAAITFACRTHLHDLQTHSRIPISSIRRRCARAVSTTAFRRWLAYKNIPHDIALTAPLTDPHEHHITIGGRKVDVVSNLITNRQAIRRLYEQPQSLLQIEISIPAEFQSQEPGSPHDLLAFSLLFAHISTSPPQTRNRMNASEMVFLLAIPPHRIWRQQRPWSALGVLILSSQDPQPISLDLCALLPDHRPTLESVTIPAGHAIELPRDWHNVLYVHTSRMPNTTLRFHSPERKANWFITPSQWSNLCFYETQLLIVGWMTRREFSRISESQTLEDQDRCRRSKPSLIPIRNLRPMSDLSRRMHHM
jgi:hypothetical protein